MYLWTVCEAFTSLKLINQTKFLHTGPLTGPHFNMCHSDGPTLLLTVIGTNEVHNVKNHLLSRAALVSQAAACTDIELLTTCSGETRPSSPESGQKTRQLIVSVMESGLTSPEPIRAEQKVAF